MGQQARRWAAATQGAAEAVAPPPVQSLGPDHANRTPGKDITPHLEYRKGNWLVTRPDKNPETVVQGTISQGAYITHGHHLPKVARQNVVEKIRVNTRELVKAAQSLKAANGKPIELDGVIFLDLSYQGRTSSQMAYVTPYQSCLILSQQACKELGMVSLDFPTVQCSRQRGQQRPVLLLPQQGGGTRATPTAPWCQPGGAREADQEPLRGLCF